MRALGCAAAWLAVWFASLVSLPLPASAGERLSPVVSAAFGPDGRLWRVRTGATSLTVDYSADLGRTFSPAAGIEPRRQRLRTDPEGRPQIAIDRNGVIYVAWTADARKALQSFVAWSTDDGRSFSPPVSPGAPAPVAPQLRPFLLPGKDSARLYVLSPAADADSPGHGGTLFESALRPDGQAPIVSVGIAASTCECCRLDADVETDGTRVVLSRMVFEGGVRDFGIIRLPPAGPPSAVLRVTDDDWRIDACPEHGAALAIGTDGRYHLAWFTQGARRQGLFYAWSDDRGRNWSRPLRIGAPDAMAGHADVLVRNAAVYLVWQQFDGNRTSVLTMRSADNGANWSAPGELAASGTAADYPLLLTDGKGVFVSWSAGPADYQLISLDAGRAREAALPAGKHEDVLRDLMPGSFAGIVESHLDTRFLLVLWSIDCAPCLREFELFAELRRQGRPLQLVLVSTDGLARRTEVEATLERFGLGDVESWIFADENAAKLRFEIDPQWYGEMPRGYFYERDSKRRAHSGGLSRAQIETWLDLPAVPLSIPPARR